ncbi:hypothetical protein TNCT_403421 [Trichonephila clavata]|uniref:Uncharacterized protein n=1 Tax=Trichonephila clavata TaxID=2740835 RepID=A0A8X6LSQ8_TRICU|nr:hypothetical protein TNCT_403421 [Trichonephila clavata]
MDPFTKQGNCPGAHSKSPILKQPLQDQVPRFDITGNLRAIPARSHSLFNKLCNLYWTTEDLFRITMQCNPWTNGIGFPTVHVSTQQYNPPTCPWTAGYLR